MRPSVSKLACCGLILAWTFLCRGPSQAQTRPVPAAAAPMAMPQLVASSGYIFAGRVKDIARIVPTNSNEVPTLRITFQVEQAIQGVRVGELLVIHEWAGLWESGQRYRPGEHLLLFLYRPSRLGMTSTVGGPLGRFKMDGAGQVILHPAQVNTLWPTSAPAVLRSGGTSMSTGAFTRAVSLARSGR